MKQYALTQQVCTVEQSQELVKLGVKLEPGLMWIKDPNGKSRHICINDEYAYEMTGLNPLPAYSVAELGLMIPVFLHKRGNTYYFFSCKATGGWEAYFDRVDEPFAGCLFRPILRESEAQARAALLIYILEEKLITVEDIALGIEPVSSEGDKGESPAR